MSRFRGVVLDWRGTLVVPLTVRRWVELGLAQVGREPAPAVVDDVLARLRALGDGADPFDSPGVDTDADRHREVYRSTFDAAGLDGELAAALYAVESDVSNDPFADDVRPVLEALRVAGVRVAVLSDIHVDIRPAFTAVGLDGLVDLFVLSFEHGLQKPDPAVFDLTLRLLGTEPAETLMVGDRSGPDGGGLALGITTLLLPPLRSTGDRRLGRVLDLCGLSR